jgi:hypothetical protein
MGLLFTDRDMADALARSIRKFDWLVAISTGKSSLCAGFEAGPVAEAGIFSGCKNSPSLLCCKTPLLYISPTTNGTRDSPL